MLLLSSFSGCTKKKTEPETVKVQPTISCTVSEETVKISHPRDVQYRKTDKVPILRSGKLYGWIRIKQVEKLGISDWTNIAAMNAGIKSSYTINMRVSWLEQLGDSEQVTLKIEPCLEDKSGQIVGKPCIVGWSGFPQTAVFSKNTSSVTIEHGVQPITNRTAGIRLVLKISDSTGSSYDIIRFRESVLKNPVQGPALADGKDGAVVKSRCGAKFRVYVSESNSEINYKDKKLLEPYSTWIFRYGIDYLSKPSSKKESPLFDRKSGNLMTTKLLIGVQNNRSGIWYYDSDTHLTRQQYSDNDDYSDYYMPAKYLLIHPGYSVEYTNNRVISDVDFKGASIVRYSFEFPEEARASSDKELMKSKCRFIVLQQRITKRRLYEQRENRPQQVPAATNDKQSKVVE